MTKEASIVLYVLVFLIAIGGFYSTQVAIQNNFRKKYIGAGFAILLLCIFASIRGEMVGTDILTYAKPAFNRMQNYTSFFSCIVNEDYGILYSMFVYISAKIFRNFQIFMFLTEMLIVIPIFSALVIINKKEPVSITIGMMFFLFFYYPMTFNLMKQSIAMGFMILTFSCYHSSKKKLAILFSIIGVLFHSSALITVLTFIIIKILVSKKIRKIAISLIIIFMIAVLSFWKKIGFWFIFETNIFPEIYKVYYNIFTTENHHYFKTTGGILGWIELVYRGINFITPLIILRKKIERVMDYKIISLISMVIYATVLISLKSIYGHRLAMCFDFIHILYFAEAFKRKHYVNKMKKSCIYFTKFQLQQVAFLFLYFVSYIVIVFMKLGYHQVVPYSFFFMH